MRLAYFAPVALGLFLVGCGPDEPEEVQAPPTTTEQPQAPATQTATPPADNDAATGTTPNTDPSAGSSDNLTTDQLRDPQSAGGSAAGVAPGTGTNQ